MNSYRYEYQPAPHRWRRYSWMIALLLGVGLGALLVGPIGGQLWFSDRHGDHDGQGPRSGQQSQATLPSAPQQNQPTAPDSTQPQRESRYADPRSRADQPVTRGSRGERYGGFFPFDEIELLVPLLLIGAGAWLIWGRRRGSGNGGSGYAPRPVEPVEPTTVPNDHPATGETRRL